MTCTDAQVRVMMRERKKGRTQEQAAVKANVKSRKTVTKYEKSGQLPSQEKQAREYRTRQDPFAEDWPAVEEKLRAAPKLEAKILFEWLSEEKPGKYQEGQLRTFQRRVADWRALNVDKEALLEQVHRPGEVVQTDGTWLTELEVSIGGQLFKHVLIHCVLPYSNWEWGAVAQSESLLALQRGLQSSLLKLRHVPQYHQTDNTSAVTHQLKRGQRGERTYNPDYEALLAHFGMKPRRIGIGKPEQNGDIEASNGGLKRSIEQHLLLRGSRAFEYRSDYEEFLGSIMKKRNRGRQNRLQEELAVMKPLTASVLKPYQEVRVKVNRGSLMRVQSNLYSVPTHLIGQQVTVQIFEWHLAVYHRQIQVAHLPRIVGQNKQQINYRHLIETLLRKPGGFRQYRYLDALFPSLVFRQAWEKIDHWYGPRKAELTYLRILHLAARYLECEVAEALTFLLQTSRRWDERAVKAYLHLDHPLPVPPLSPLEIDLTDYDQLLLGEEENHENS